MQHPIRLQRRDQRLPHHRDQRPPEPLLGARLQGVGLPAGVRRHQAGTGLLPRSGRGDGNAQLSLRGTVGRLHDREDPPVGPQQVLRREP